MEHLQISDNISVDYYEDGVLLSIESDGKMITLNIVEFLQIAEFVLAKEGLIGTKTINTISEWCRACEGIPT